MSFSKILGQDRAVEKVRRIVNEGRVGHSYLFFGPDGIGKRTIAIKFAQALNCDEYRDDICGECLSCRKIGGMNHPDLFLIEPDGEYIKIEQARELQRKINLKVYEGKKKVVIINQAQKMTIEAANALLKVLEEPPPDTVLILLANNRDSLLPTIVSRCQIIRFNLLNKQVQQNLFMNKQDMDKEQAELLSHLYQGIGEKKSDLDFNRLLIDRRKIIDNFLKLDMNKIEDIFNLAAKWSAKKEDAKFFINMLQIWFRDVLYIKNKVDKQGIMNFDKFDELVLEGKKFSIEEIFNRLNILENKKIELDRNTNLKLTLEVLLMELIGDSF